MIGVAFRATLRAPRSTTPARPSSAATARTHEGRSVELPTGARTGTGSGSGSMASAAVRTAPAGAGAEGCVAAFGTRARGRRSRAGRRIRGALVRVRAGRAARARPTLRDCCRRLGRVRVRAVGAGFATEGAATARTDGTGGRSPTSPSTAAAAGAAAGVGAGETAAGGDSGAGTAAPGEDRGGSRVSGSTYPFGSSARLMPRWTYGTSSSASPEGPIVPIGSASATPSPALTTIEPR
jgi:hypothetical protein